MELTERLIIQLKQMKKLEENDRIHRAYLSPAKDDIMFVTESQVYRVELSALPDDLVAEILGLGYNELLGGRPEARVPETSLETRPFPEVTTFSEPAPETLEFAPFEEVKGESNPIEPPIVEEKPKRTRRNF